MPSKARLQNQHHVFSKVPVAATDLISSDFSRLQLAFVEGALATSTTLQICVEPTRGRDGFGGGGGGGGEG